jgi:rod shape-determining protein MreD
MEHNQPHARRLVISWCCAVILQVMLAAHIAIVEVVPNLMMIAVVITAVYHSPTRSSLYGFILGLCYDLLAQGPLGCTALIFTLLGYTVSSITKGSFVGNRLVELLVVMVAILCGEILEGVVLAVVGYDNDIFYSLVFRALPGFLYTGIIAALVFFVMGIFHERSSRTKPGQLTLHSKKNMLSKSLKQGRPLNRKLR